ncbi:MAG: riboflavin synthase [Clostridium sp.]|nr:riboflavin synthase [Clostridium sp.]
MFTGLIEEIGIISNIKKQNSSVLLTVKCKKILDGLKIGDSVGINGACQTVTEINTSEFSVFASYETLAVTNFTNLKVGDEVNLERTLRLSDRLDGHIVSGHIDGIAKVTSVEKIGETTKFSFETSHELAKQIVKKGSVSIDGISLTVADINKNVFSIAVIPHTLKSTTLHNLRIGSSVNLETDMIAKYVEKYLLPNDNNSNIDADFLERNGFI